jgi:ferredoxin-NADP reductase
MTQHIDKMKAGDKSLKITAIGGDLTYHGQGQFESRDPETKEMKARHIKRVGMIAAGSGIAPMY